MGLKLIAVLCAILCYWVISFHSIYSESIHVDGIMLGLLVYGLYLLLISQKTTVVSFQ